MRTIFKGQCLERIKRARGSLLLDLLPQHLPFQRSSTQTLERPHGYATPHVEAGQALRLERDKRAQAQRQRQGEAKKKKRAGKEFGGFGGVLALFTPAWVLRGCKHVSRSLVSDPNPQQVTFCLSWLFE